MSHHDNDVLSIPPGSSIHYRVWCLSYINQGGYGTAPYLQNKRNETLLRQYLAGEHGRPEKSVARVARLALETLKTEGSNL